MSAMLARINAALANVGLGLLRLAARIRHAIISSQHTTDMLLAALAIAAGVWLLIPGWPWHRFRHIAEQMAVVWPVWTWGALFVTDGAASVVGVITERPAIIVASHLVGVGLWLFLGGIMTFRTVPAMEGFFCGVAGTFCLIRLAQIPTDQ